MRKVLILGFTFLAVSALVGCSSSSGPSGGGVTFDLSGVWQATLTHVSVTGPCPRTPTQRGAITIDQAGDTFTLTFGDDFECNPAGACSFAGTVSGSDYSASNSGPIPGGGTYSTTFEVTATSERSAAGSGESTVAFGGAQFCRWVTNLTLNR